MGNTVAPRCRYRVGGGVGPGGGGVWAEEAGDPALVEYPSSRVIDPTRKVHSRVYFPVTLPEKKPRVYLFERELLRGIELKGHRATTLGSKNCSHPFNRQRRRLGRCAYSRTRRAARGLAGPG